MRHSFRLRGNAPLQLWEWWCIVRAKFPKLPTTLVCPIQRAARVYAFPTIAQGWFLCAVQHDKCPGGYVFWAFDVLVFSLCFYQRNEGELFYSNCKGQSTSIWLSWHLEHFSMLIMALNSLSSQWWRILSCKFMKLSFLTTKRLRGPIWASPCTEICIWATYFFTFSQLCQKWSTHSSSALLKSNIGDLGSNTQPGCPWLRIYLVIWSLMAHLSMLFLIFFFLLDIR